MNRTEPLPPTGLIAILRGLTPADAPAVGDILREAGFRRLEVTLNSPDPFTSIELLAQRLPDVVIGGGTVVTVDDVDRVRDAGGRIVVSPNTDPAVIGRSLELGLEPFPGVATPTDVFAALGAGARALKIFPAPSVGIDGMKAWSAVVPPDTQFLPVGGIDAGNLGDWLAAGAQGAGIGSTLYKPGRDTTDLERAARDLMTVWNQHEENDQ
ncbi:MAG TPA: 2-dehydro-3-deoxy-6-phosphogalactonate aldolase [Candidatus Corynebacterium avicola]|uniref:2-dehydro-3-deoxy-6-phosphogalactonate aldolase n=1 Tax=Candidatus Corynebacterium avicola TaxID=2838527 RepID=A0A9D1RQU3_9CORY|nr:2-dehydro-3-deoxy-6-phosphogalactonate aldolase [Candidatus Corynebacterium avicola]